MKQYLRNKAGFTLVELIVVIAILGILAGVGTVGYSGYIKKANQAADEQLRGYVNSAFAAACLENGVDVQDVNSVSLNLIGADGAKKVSSVSLYDGEFKKYYAGNENSEFKVFTKLLFDAEKHAFVDPVTAGEVSMAYGGGVVKISSEDAAKLADSTFITANGLGVLGLLNKVNEVTEFASMLTGTNAVEKVIDDPTFQTYLATALGVDTTQAGYEEMMGQKTEDLVNQMKASGLSEEAALNKLTANMMVMYAASNATQMDKADIVNLFSSTGARATITADLNTDPGKALSEAALAYGMYTAYAYSTGNTDLIKTTRNPGAVLDHLEDRDFLAYMNNAQASTDLDGYLSALNMINNSKNDPDAVAKVVVNGFNDADLIALLNQAVSNA